MTVLDWEADGQCVAALDMGLSDELDNKRLATGERAI
jgi:hypothetical protein